MYKSEPMKFLFLDLDGVMVTDNSPSDYGPYRSWIFNKECVRVLNEIIEETDCYIALSSDWRHNYNLRQIKDIFLFNEVHKYPLSFTGYFPVKTVDGGWGAGWVPRSELVAARGKEITAWQTQHGIYSTYPFIAVVDDMDLSKHTNRFVRTKYEDGIAGNDIKEKVIFYLNGEFDPIDLTTLSPISMEF